MQQLSRTIIDLLLREPFYAHVLMGINKVFVADDPLAPTLGLTIVAQNPVLYINTKFWESLSAHPQHRNGLLKHEVLHLLFRHQLTEEPGLDCRLMHVAMDLAVNQYIDPETLPADSLFLYTFPEWELKAGQTWHYYYEALEKWSRRSDQAETAAMNSLIAIRPDSHGLERHLVWQKAKRRPAEKEIEEVLLTGFFRRIADQMPDTAWKILPETLQEHLPREPATPAAINWRLALRLFAESSSKTRLRHTVSRPSKRYGNRPGIKIQPRKRLLVAIDTSGSISCEDRSAFFGELHHIWRRGTEIEVVECDEVIHATWLYKGQERGQHDGGGGTDFNAPIRYGNEQARPDGLIYFTDGWGPLPSVKPAFPMLWVISPKGWSPENPAFVRLPGRRVKLEK